MWGPEKKGEQNGRAGGGRERETPKLFLFPFRKGLFANPLFILGEGGRKEGGGEGKKGGDTRKDVTENFSTLFSHTEGRYENVHESRSMIVRAVSTEGTSSYAFASRSL